MCFWLFSWDRRAAEGTGTCIAPHRHLQMLYAKPILGIANPTVFSARSSFSGLGLGNSLSFSAPVGATAILMAERPTPDAVFKRLSRRATHDFFIGTTLYAALLASPNFPER